MDFKMLRATTAALIAIISTTAASAEGAYLGCGFASVSADESALIWIESEDKKYNREIK